MQPEAPCRTERPHAGARVTADDTTNSTTYSDLLTCNLTLTGSQVMVNAEVDVTITNALHNAQIQLAIDGVAVAGTERVVGFDTVDIPQSCSIAAYVSSVPTGTRTFSIQWKTTDAAGTVQCRPATTKEGAGITLMDVGGPFQVWTPLAAGPEFLYDSDTVVIGADPDVATWTDLSGYGRDMTQGTAGLRPHRIAGAINGHNAIRFDGSDDYMSATVNWTTPFHCFLVASITYAGGSKYIIDSVATDDNLFYKDAGGHLYMYSNGGGGSIHAAPPSNGLHLLEWVWDGATSAFYYDGGAAAASGNTNAHANTGFRMGASGAGTSCSDMDTTYFVGYARVLAAGTQTSVRNYLKARYGTP